MFLLQIDLTKTPDMLLVIVTAAIINALILYMIIKASLNGARSTAYLEAQLKLTAMMAKRNGVNSSDIKYILERADPSIISNDIELKNDLLQEDFKVAAH
jgi:hypothetical protein